jgi:hypothetical protein
MSQADGKGFSIGDWFQPIAHGMMAGSISAAQFASVTSAKWVKFKAKNDNTGFVFIGIANTVTKGASSTDPLAGWELDAGQEIDLPIIGGNLSGFWYICDATTDDVYYLVYG